MVNKHAIVLGDNGDRAPYHPLVSIESELRSILGDNYVLDSTEDYNVLSTEKLNRYDLFISCTDCFRGEVADEQITGLLSYVSAGGKLLVIHNGISLQVREEFSKMVGARFTGHPPYQLLNFHPTAADHPIMQGTRPFSMEDEPYLFQFHSPLKDDLTILLSYTLDGEIKPAAWTASYGKGRFVYLMPGHSLPSFQQEAYRTLIRSSADWLVSLE
ncbi:ThuA domain-containing protein [Paenibacillus solisilvae]|uniref:ThuA domain-containing protein n=1 Tax=Paenibacillus solisilvae TaxID=2486751 RepID=A0ABW0VWA1_9BACL